MLLKNGQMLETMEYMYLGNMITTEGNVNRQLREVEKKAQAIIVAIESMGSEKNLGRMSTVARLLMYKRMAIPTILYNLEVSNGVTNGQWEELKRIQGMCLRKHNLFGNIHKNTH